MISLSYYYTYLYYISDRPLFYLNFFAYLIHAAFAQGYACGINPNRKTRPGMVGVL